MAQVLSSSGLVLAKTGPTCSLGVVSMVLFFDNWGDYKCGQSINAVSTMKIFDVRHRAHLMSSIPGNVLFQFNGVLPEGKCWYTFIDAVVDGIDPLFKLGSSPDTRVLPYDAPTWDSVRGLVEACSGMGALGFGARTLGFMPMVGTDHNEKMLGLWTNLHGKPGVLEEVCNPQVAAKIWNEFPHPGSLAAGYSCQPYSFLGDRLGQGDPRSRSLPGTLRLAHYIRSQIIVLECVTGASQDPWCRETLKSFASEIGYHMREVELHLHDLWPSKRSRWWVVLTSDFVGPIELLGSDFLRDAMRVRQVFPSPCHWSPIDEMQLSLTCEEQIAFQVSDDRASPFLLNINGTCPTALHAWGSQYGPCPCGCRSQKLAASRIDEKGLFGVITRSALACDGSFHYRHLHPSELAALVGMDPVLHYDDDMKLGLCALGQLASPLQSSWVFAQIFTRLERLKFGINKRPAIEHFLAYKTWLLMRCRQVWPDATPIAANLERAIAAWQPAHDLSLHELLDLKYWKPLCTETLSLAYVLESAFEGRLGNIIQESLLTQSLPPTVPDDDVLPDFHVHVRFHEPGFPGIQVRVSPGHVVQELQQAEEHHLGLCLSVVSCVSVHGRMLDSDVLEPDCVVTFALSERTRPIQPQVPLLMLEDGSPHDFAEETPVPTSDLGVKHLTGAFSWECGQLPRMPVHEPSLPPPPEGDHCDFRECGPLPIMPVCLSEPPRPEGVPNVRSPFEADGALHADPDEVLVDELQVGSSNTKGNEGYSLECLSCLPALTRPPPLEGDVVPVTDCAVESDSLSSNCGALGEFSTKTGDGLLDSLLADLQYDDERQANHPCFTTVGSATEVIPATLPFKRKFEPESAKFVSSASPLCHLDAPALLRLQGPQPTSPDALQGLLMQHLTAQDRETILERQGTIWADDEIRWHLDQLALQFKARLDSCLIETSFFSFDKVKPVDPLLLHGWLSTKFEGCDLWLEENFVSGTCLVAAVYTAAHWTPVMMWQSGPYLQVRTWDVPTADHTLITDFALYVAACKGLEPLFDRLHRMYVEGKCGVFAIAFLRSVLLQDVLPELDCQVTPLHDILRLKFLQCVQFSHTTAKPWLWANGQTEQAVSQLTTILAQQGVPDDQLDPRARAAVRAIGAQDVLKAFDAKNPWRQLKVLGNQVKFQFILPSELEQKVATKAGSTMMPKAKGGKRPRKSFDPPAAIELDPSKLLISPGTFECSGQPLRQIQIHQVGPLAEGVVLCRASDAEPYLRSGKPISKGPLALLILHGPHEKWTTTLAQSQVTAPCQCVANNEPLLIDATMVQIGSGSVVRKVSQATVSIDTIDVASVKVVVYRDELQMDWESFIEAPVKCIIGLLPPLTICDADPCDCQCWHNREKINTKSAVLDVWRRQFLRAGFKPEPAGSATIYSVCLRVPTCLLESLLQISGLSGLYVEPRTLDSKEVDPNYVIVWLPKMSNADLHHHKQVNPTAIGLARVGDRRGLRTLAIHAAQLHNNIRPESTFLPQGARQSWLIGPLPFGTDRASIGKALKSLPWEARVLQPTSTVVGKGNVWLVQSVQPPPVTVLQMPHGDVMISRQKTNVPEAKSSTSVPVASPETLALCGKTMPTNSKPVASAQVPAKGFDVWTVQPDPWAKWNGPGPAVHDTMRQMETKIHDAVLAKLPQPQAMEQDHIPDRISTLESQVQGLMHKQQSLETQVAEHASKHTSQLNALQNQVHGQAEAAQQNMAAMFEAQMAQIRSLLAKRKSDDSDL